jgi:2-polyprenyl-6-methoxyphenol hydroxylase-like FAD-dependent oxidoreductase
MSIETDLETDVVVVGAGPVGLMLAGELRLGGADVVVVERLREPTTESRASTLHARTMELLDARGLLDALGTPPCDLRGHFGGIPLDLAQPSPYQGQWKVPQTTTEALLQDWAVDLGAALRRGHEVRQVVVDDDAVTAVADGPTGRLQVRARYLVGCDGEQSSVRALIGADFPGQDAARALLRADVRGIEIRDRRFERLEHGLAIAARRPDGVTRVMTHVFGESAAADAEPTFADVCAAWLRVTGEDISGGTPIWVNAFGDANRQVARYRHGRVLLAGDAAHIQMPAGGQALNLGLQDAMNLGWKLAACARDRAPDELLDSYHEERHAVGRRVLANIKAQALLLLGGREVEPLRALLGELIAYEDVRAHLAGMISGVDVRYRLGDGHPLQGARLAPAALDGPAGRTSTAALLRAGRHVLLDLTGRTDGELRAAADPWADRVDVVTARPSTPADAAALRGIDVALVRPDGYLAWVAPCADPLPDALPDALRHWVGYPAATTASAGSAR